MYLQANGISNIKTSTIKAAIPSVLKSTGGCGYFIADVTTRLVTDKSIGEHLDSSKYSFSYKF